MARTGGRVRPEEIMNDQPRYDRELLLLGAKRNAVLELWEVQRYGSDSYGDTDYVSIYGMRPADWHAKGARLLGRTAVECTRDIGRCDWQRRRRNRRYATIHGPGARRRSIRGLRQHTVLAPAALPGASAVGFESDAGDFRLTRQNISALALPIDILNTDYLSGLAGLSVASEDLLIAFIAPPWGDGLVTTSGVDLRRTTPP